MTIGMSTAVLILVAMPVIAGVALVAWGDTTKQRSIGIGLLAVTGVVLLAYALLGVLA